MPQRDRAAGGTAGTGTVGGTIFRPLSVYRRFEIFMNSSFLAGIASFLLFFLIFKLLLQQFVGMQLSPCLSIHLSKYVMYQLSPSMQRERETETSHQLLKSSIIDGAERLSTDLRNTLTDQRLLIA